MNTNLANILIGGKIKNIRKKQGKTQQQLADEIGKTVSSVRKYEKGLVNIPFEVLNKIAYALGVNIEQFAAVADHSDKAQKADGKAKHLKEYFQSLGYNVNETLKDINIPVQNVIKEGLEFTLTEKEKESGFVISKEQCTKLTNISGESIELNSEEFDCLQNEIEEFVKFALWKRQQN